MKLIAIDLDGTLLSRKGVITETNQEAIRRRQDQGDIVAISSGRSIHDIEEILKRSNLTCPILSGNGAIAFYENERIYYHSLPKQVVQELWDIARAHDTYVEFYTNAGVKVLRSGTDLLKGELDEVLPHDQSFTREWGEREIEIQNEQFGLTYVETIEDIDFEADEVYKVFIYSFDRRKLHKLRKLYEPRTDILITTAGWTKIEIGHPKASKGMALEQLAAHHHIAKQDIVAIGDNLNDVSMFEVAETCIAMGNAVDALKDISTHITRDVEADGVAYALDQYV
ncbi:Cof-type HAD-IIB family hydrolase [Exiguobacterium sp.]|uniref:Cof-type HAD-IIB family hydrolase n=1 Tax=Exiguobacterium sp. TaxID=44751 RepID=UPI00263ADABF|nr:Cof-type HAD-IIB family hydrolase [Exiguobacterium sp.]MCC5893361.1 HAD family phosphatase [Exiguobacterium sp.]